MGASKRARDGGSGGVIFAERKALGEEKRFHRRAAALAFVVGLVGAWRWDGGGAFAAGVLCVRQFRGRFVYGSITKGPARNAEALSHRMRGGGGDDEVARLRRELQEQHTMRVDLSHQMTEVRLELGKRERDLEVANHKIVELTMERDRLCVEMQRGSKVRALEDELDDVRRGRELAIAEAREWRGRAMELEHMLKELKMEWESCGSQLNDAVEAFRAMERRTVRVDAECDAGEDEELVGLRAQCSAIECERDELWFDLEQLRRARKIYVEKEKLLDAIVVLQRRVAEAEAVRACEASPFVAAAACGPPTGLRKELQEARMELARAERRVEVESAKVKKLRSELTEVRRENRQLRDRAAELGQRLVVRANRTANGCNAKVWRE